MNQDNASDITARSVTRRALLAGSAVSAVAAAASAAPPIDAVPKVTLGRTGMKVSRLALGGSWDVDQEVLGLAFSLGMNYLDTAESYRNGQSERAMGEFLKSRGAVGHSAARKKVWLVTKSHRHRGLEAQLPGSLERLQQDYVDCCYMHQIDNPALATDPEIKAMANRLKKSGKTRFFGFSVHDQPVVECLNSAAKSDFIDVIMFRYDCHYYPREELMRAIDRCSKAGIGLIAMKTQVGGMTLPDRFDPFKKRGLNQFQSAIKAVAMDDRIHSVCSEMTTINMIEQNASAIAMHPTAPELEAIREHASLVSHLWCRGCDSICRGAAGTGSQIAVADSLRFLMYHDHYGKQAHARELYAALSPEARDAEAMAAADWKGAERACPHNVPVEKLMRRVMERLA